MDIDNKQKLLIEMIMRQTMYTYDQAKDKLEENDNNYMLVIKKALGIVEKPPTSVPSINQGIYKEIRGLMDTVSTNHRENQEKEREREEYNESLKKKQQAQQKQAQQKQAQLNNLPVIMEDNEIIN